MSGATKDVARRLAMRIYKDPTADAEKKQLARCVLFLLDGKLPK
jgi:hypothetical protein